MISINLGKYVVWNKYNLKDIYKDIYVTNIKYQTFVNEIKKLKK